MMITMYISPWNGVIISTQRNKGKGIITLCYLVYSLLNVIFIVFLFSVFSMSIHGEVEVCYFECLSK